MLAQLKKYVMGQQEALRKNVLPDDFRLGNFQDAITAQQKRIVELNACLYFKLACSQLVLAGIT